MPVGLVQDAPDDIKPVSATIKSEFRFGAALKRQTCHTFRIDIRRVGDDEIIAPGSNRRVQVAAIPRYAIFETEIPDIARRNRKRILGDIDRIDMCVRKGATGENGKAPGTGAKFQHVLNRARVLDQLMSFAVSSTEMRVQKFADKGARHNDALVDVEGQAAHIDLVDEIGGGLA